MLIFERMVGQLWLPDLYTILTLKKVNKDAPIWIEQTVRLSTSCWIRNKTEMISSVEMIVLRGVLIHWNGNIIDDFLTIRLI